jgi:uncharacterized protein (UPF0212 family)
MAKTLVASRLRIGYVKVKIGRRHCPTTPWPFLKVLVTESFVNPLVLVALFYALLDMLGAP